MMPNVYQQECKRTEASQYNTMKRLMGDPNPSSHGVSNDHPGVQAFRLIHGCIGVINELGEITSTLQKRFWYGKAITDDEMRAKIKDEAGDLCWHLMEILNSYDIPFADVLKANLDKLMVRYPDAGWSKEACENRDREAEAKAVGGVVDPADVNKDWPMRQEHVAHNEQYAKEQQTIAELKATRESCDK